jgi:hypothetical protein
MKRRRNPSRKRNALGIGAREQQAQARANARERENQRIMEILEDELNRNALEAVRWIRAHYPTIYTPDPICTE